MSFEELVKEFFLICVYALQVIGGSPGEFGFGYYLANIIIFVFIQPLLILLFFFLWRRALKKNKILEEQIVSIKGELIDEATTEIH